MTPEEEMLLTTFGPCNACGGPRVSTVVHDPITGFRNYTLRCVEGHPTDVHAVGMPPEAEAPNNPFSKLSVSSIQMHEWFRAMREAGFTHEEAVDILVGVLTSG